MLYATIPRTRPTAVAEAGAGAADDPVDGDSATAHPGPGRADRAGDARRTRCSICRRTTPTCPPSRSRRPTEAGPDAPTEEERELVIDEAHSNEDDFERLMKMDEEWPDHFEERSRPSRAEQRGGGRTEAGRHGQHDRPAAIPPGLPPRSVGLVRAGRRRCGRWPSGSSTTSTANGYLQGRPRGPFGLGGEAGGAWRWPSGPWRWCRSSTRRASRPATSASASSCS